MDNLDVLSNMSGISKEDIKKIMEKVKENDKRLKECDPPHDFSIALTLSPRLKKWKCSKCKGEIDNIYKCWYEKGLEHGMGKNQGTTD